MKYIGIISIILGGLISLANWVCLYRSWKTKRHISSAPLIGAILLVFGLFKFEVTRPYAWIGIFVDYGTLVLICSIPVLIKEFWSTSRANLIREYDGFSSTTHHNLKLYKNGVFVIESKVDPPVPANEYGALIGSFGFQGKWTEIGNSINLREYAEDRTLDLQETNGKLISRETNYPDGKEHQYDSLEGIEFCPK
jgi:hypothetical protein